MIRSFAMKSSAALVRLAASAAVVLFLFSHDFAARGDEASASNADAARRFEWPQYKGDVGQSGVSPDDSVKPPLKLRWSYRMDGDASYDAGAGLIVGGGRVYSNVYNSRSLIALDADTGELLWELDDAQLTHYTAPAYADEKLVLWVRSWHKNTSALVVLDARDAKELWRKELDGLGHDPLRTSIPVANGKIYVAEGGAAPAVSVLSLEDGKTIWRSDIPAGHGIHTITPTIAGGRVFTATRVNNRFNNLGPGGKILEGAVTALDEKTGKVLWTREGIYPYRTMATDGQALTVPMNSSPDKKLHVLDCATGETLWSGPARNHYAPATLTADRVLAKPYGSMIIAHDRATGEQQWTFDGQGRSGCCSPVVSGNFAYMGTGIPHPLGDLEALWSFGHVTAPRESGKGSTLYAVDLRTGEPAWRFSTGNTICGEAAIAYGRLYFTSRDGRAYCFEPAGEDEPSLPVAKDESPAAPPDQVAKLLAEARDHAIVDSDWPMQGRDPLRRGFSPADLGDELKPAWMLDVKGGIVASPVAQDGRAFVGTLAGTVVAADLATGKQLWSHDCGAAIRCAPALADDFVYCGAENGKFVALSADDGKVRWTFEAGAPIQASPAVSGGLIVFGAHDHNLYCLDRRTGKKLWNFTARGAFVQAPPVIAGDRVFAAQWHDWVWALDAKTGKPLWKSFVPVSIESLSAVSGPSSVAEGAADSAITGRTVSTADNGQRTTDKLYVRSPYYVLELDAATGKRLRIGNASYGYGGIAIAGDSVFQSGIKGQYGTTGLTRIDLNAPTKEPADYPTMDDVRRFDPQSLGNGLVSMAAPLATRDRVLVSTRDGRLVLADHAGKILQQHDLESKSHAPPIIAGEFVLVGTDAGALHAFGYGKSRTGGN
ncbi:MAG: PQQ-binding-like beta-propeller repeat protein [Planctomycetaceae bacterium]